MNRTAKGHPKGVPFKQPPDEGELRAIYDNCTVKQTCEFYGITKMTLNVWLRKFGIPMKRAKYKQSSENMMPSHFDSDKPLTELDAPFQELVTDPDDFPGNPGKEP